MPGTTVRVTATHIDPAHAPYDLVVGTDVLASGLSPDADGTLTVDVVIPADRSGSADLELRIGATQQLVAATSISIGAGTSTTTGSFAFGAAVLLLVLVAAFLIGRRRRDTATAAGPTVGAPAGHSTPPPAAALPAPTAAAAAPASSPAVLPITATRPWSSASFARSPIADAALTDLVAWDGALWVTGLRRAGAGHEVIVAASLNGITWSPPTVLGPGLAPHLVADPSHLCVVAHAETHPMVWMSRDGIDWCTLAEGEERQPSGTVSASIARNGMVLLGGTHADRSVLWAGRRDGEWLRIDLASTPEVLSVWNDRLFAMGRRDDGAHTIARSDAGIRWTPSTLDVPPSFLSFRPAALATLNGKAMLVGTDSAIGVADAWTSVDCARWDPVPLGAEQPSDLIGGVAADGGLVVVGHENGRAAAWRTTQGLTWQRTDDDDAFTDATAIAVARYEGRVHVLCQNEDTDAAMWIRQPWADAPADRGPASLAIAVDAEDDAAVDRTA